MSDQHDLVARLRSAADAWRRDGGGSDLHLGDFDAGDARNCDEAASRIEALEGRQRVLREALEPFAAQTRVSSLTEEAMILRARAALAGDAP